MGNDGNFDQSGSNRDEKSGQQSGAIFGGFVHRTFWRSENKKWETGKLRMNTGLCSWASRVDGVAIHWDWKDWKI